MKRIKRRVKIKKVKLFVTCVTALAYLMPSYSMDENVRADFMKNGQKYAEQLGLLNDPVKKLEFMHRVSNFHGNSAQFNVFMNNELEQNNYKPEVINVRIVEPVVEKIDTKTEDVKNSDTSSEDDIRFIDHLCLNEIISDNHRKTQNFSIFMNMGGGTMNVNNNSNIGGYQNVKK